MAVWDSVGGCGAVSMRFVSSLPSPACHWLHGSFQGMLEGYYDRHWPCHHENQRQQDGADGDQEDSQEDALHGETAWGQDGKGRGGYIDTPSIKAYIYHKGKTAVRANYTMAF